MNNKLAGKRLRESLAIILIGDGVVGFVNPERHARLWRRGPGAYQKAMEAFVRRPGMMQIVSVAEVALGIWLASRQEADRLATRP